MSENKKLSRREFMKFAGTSAAALAIPVGTADASIWDAFFKKNFREMGQTEVRNLIEGLKENYAKEYGGEFNIKSTPPIPGVKYGYGLDLSRCIGCRKCVYACVEENNQSRDPQIH
ncbi:twin-arginine translocation signal domain-containing protein, partial [bacterium]|nr:twin-arginine translocation signal domain-containing protein [bacterium]